MKFLKKYREHLIVIGALTVICGYLFYKPLTGDYYFMGGDSQSPKAVRQGIELAEEQHGEYPYWMPWVFSGLPSVHSFQNISQYYLPHQIFKALKNIGVPGFWEFLIHYLFAGLGCFVLLRWLKMGFYAALLGGMSFMLMPYMITMIVHGHGSQMMTSAYIPWIIWALMKLTDDPSFKNTGVFALLVGLQLLRAHLQIAYYTWLMIGLYLLILLVRIVFKQKWWRLKVFAMSIIGSILGFGMAMTIYLPVLSYTPFSTRGSGGGGGTGYEYATQWSFSFSEMMTFLVPSFFGFGGRAYWGDMPFTDYPNYMGILILLLAIIGAVKSRGNIRLLLISTAFIALILSFGKNFFLYRIFYDIFPFFNKFRVPTMFLILTQFSTVILAGLGLHYLSLKGDDPKIKKMMQYFFYGIIAISVVLLVFGSSILKLLPLQPNHPALNFISADTFTLVIILIVVGGILFAWSKNWLEIKIVLPALLAISMIDLVIVDKKIIEPSKDSLRMGTLQKASFRNAYLREDDVIKFLKSDKSEFRIFPLGQLQNSNRWTAFNLESIGGYHPAKMNNYNRLMTEVGFNSFGVLRMLNVKYLISLEAVGHPALKEVFRGKIFNQGRFTEAFVYQLQYPLPRVFFTEKITQISDWKQQSLILKIPNFNPITDSFVSEKIDEISGRPENAHIEILSKKPNQMTIKTDTEKNGFLVFSEIFYPEGWIVKIDDQEMEIFEVNSVLRGIIVPTGTHEIVMSFQPSDLKYGMLISSISFLLAIGMFISPFAISLFKKNKIEIVD